jgi:hypothetical protein
MKAFFRLLFLPLQNTLYVDYIVGRPNENAAYNFKLDDPPIVKLGRTSDDTCYFYSYTKFIKTDDSTSFIGYSGNTVFKYLIKEDSVGLIDSIELEISVDYMRLSSDSKWLILWGRIHQTNLKRL